MKFDRQGGKAPLSAALEAAEKSEELIALLRRKSGTVSRIGGQMQEIAITVFGSLGRREMRE